MIINDSNIILAICITGVLLTTTIIIAFIVDYIDKHKTYKDYHKVDYEEIIKSLADKLD